MNGSSVFGRIFISLGLANNVIVSKREIYNPMQFEAFFFIQSMLLSNTAFKGFIYIVSKCWKQLYFLFRSIRTRRLFDRQS